MSVSLRGLGLTCILQQGYILTKKKSRKEQIQTVQIHCRPSAVFMFYLASRSRHATGSLFYPSFCLTKVLLNFCNLLVYELLVSNIAQQMNENWIIENFMFVWLFWNLIKSLNSFQRLRGQFSEKIFKQTDLV